jgi:hypothetical protein
MKICVLSGQIDFEEYAVYGLFPSLAAAQAGAERLIVEYGGRGRHHEDAWKNNPRPDEWHFDQLLGCWHINVKKSGYGLDITEHEMETA